MCDAAALQVCVQLSHGYKLMGWELPNNCHTSFHMFLTMLLLLHLLLLRRRAATCPCGRSVAASQSADRHLQTDENLCMLGGGSTYLSWWHIKCRRSAAQNAEARAPPPGHGDDRLLEGAAKSGAGSKPVMNPSLRWAIIFPPGAHCAGSRLEMGCPSTEHLLTIAPESSQRLKRLHVQ